MAGANKTLADRLETSSHRLFLVGGVLVVAYGVLLGLQAATDTTYQTAGSVLAGSGGALAFLGLLGLYPRVADANRWLARTAAGAAIVGAVGFAVVALGAAAVVAGLLPQETTDGPSAVFLLVLVGMLLGFGLFGIASYRSGTQSNRTSLLLFAPAVVFALVVGSGAAGLTQPWVPAVLGTLHGLSYLAIGTSLRAAVHGENVDRPADSTV